MPQMKRGRGGFAIAVIGWCLGASVALGASSEALVALVNSGDIGKLKAYLSMPGVNVNDRSENDQSLLDYAAEQNQTVVTRFLIDNGARVDAFQTQGPNRGLTPLHRAAMADAADVAELLLAHGAEVNVRGPLGITPLILAASNGSRRTAEILLSHGADISVPTGHRETALSEATAHGHLDIVRLLLMHVTVPDTKGLNSLAARGDLEGLRLILLHDELVHDVDVASKDRVLRYVLVGGSNALEDRKQMIELLLAHGADVDNRVDGAPDTNTPIILASTPEMAALLLSHGANRKVPQSGSLLAQTFSCNSLVKDPVGMLNVLISHGIDLNAGAPGGVGPLSCAVRTNQPAVVEFLLAHGVPVDSADPNSRTALFAATDRPMIELLLKHGANINALDRFSRTPLAIATASGNTNLVAALTALGADAHMGALTTAVPGAQGSSTSAAFTVVTDPRIAEIRDATVDLRATVESQTVDTVALVTTKQIASQDAAWNPKNPKWPAMFQKVRADLSTDLAAPLTQSLLGAQEVWNQALRAALSDADIEQLLGFLRSDQGKRYIRLQRSLDVVVKAASIEMLQNLLSRPPGEAPPSQTGHGARATLLDLSLSMQMAQRNLRALVPGGTAGGVTESAFAIITQLAVSEHGAELDQLGREYQRDLDRFAAFNRSKPLEQIFAANQSAMTRWIASPASQQLPSAVSASISARMPMWRAAYGGDNQQAACVALETLDSSRQPPELYRDVRECVNQEKYLQAAALFALAGIYSRFDAERVSDKTAGQAGQILIMFVFEGMSDGRRERFGAGVKELAADKQALVQLCSNVNAIGYPTYYPSYMILHGMATINAALAGKPQESGLDPSFDAPKTWRALENTYLNCPESIKPASVTGVQPAVETPTEKHGSVRCDMSDYKAWYNSQSQKPSPEESIAKFNELGLGCHPASAGQTVQSSVSPTLIASDRRASDAPHAAIANAIPDNKSSAPSSANIPPTPASDGEFPSEPVKHLPAIKSIPVDDQIVLEVRNKNTDGVPNEIGVFNLTRHTEAKWDVVSDALREIPAVAFGSQADWARGSGKLLYATTRSVHLISREGTASELRLQMPGKLFALQGMTAYALSADGQRVAYMLYTRDIGEREPDRYGKLYTDLMYQRIEGSPPISLWNDQSVVLRPAWRPDGAAIAHTDSEQNLVVSDLNGRTLWSFHPGPVPQAGSIAGMIAGDINEIRWDPSGKRLAYLMGLPIPHIYVVNADGSGNKPIEFHGFLVSGKDLSIRSFAWSPDGHRFVFRTDAGKRCNYTGVGYKIETGNFPCIYSKNLFIADVDGSHLTKITPTPDYDSGELFWIQ
jgi:ankyrin repeat protein